MISTILKSAAAALLAMVVVNDRVTRETRQVVVVTSREALAGKPPVAPGETVAPDEMIVYWRLRTAALHDAWPAPATEDRATGPHDSSVPNRRALLKELLGS